MSEARRYGLLIGIISTLLVVLYMATLGGGLRILSISPVAIIAYMLAGVVAGGLTARAEQDVTRRLRVEAGAKSGAIAGLCIFCFYMVLAFIYVLIGMMLAGQLLFDPLAMQLVVGLLGLSLSAGCGATMAYLIGPTSTHGRGDDPTTEL